MTREEAIKELNEEFEIFKNGIDSTDWENPNEELAKIIEANTMAIKALEIELLTDTEQRIFLKAINREREVCQKVDDEYSDDDSKVSLVRVCNSIERKVKKIWE